MIRIDAEWYDISTIVEDATCRNFEMNLSAAALMELSVFVLALYKLRGFLGPNCSDDFSAREHQCFIICACKDGSRAEKCQAHCVVHK
jgi:hypothetical protein